MALLDHFRPPLSRQRQWRAFHTGWAENLTADLNRRLPEGYFAEPTASYGIEVDVATFAEPAHVKTPHVLREVVTVPYLEHESPAVTPRTEWQAPQPLQSIPFQPGSETVEVLIYDGRSGPLLVGAIELVSPANKDRPAERSIFVSKCEAYLSQGIGLIVVDIVTTRTTNLHNELLQRLGVASDKHLQAELYTVAYRVVERRGEPALDLWPVTLVLGGPLPMMPLWLSGELCIPIALDETYVETCSKHRIIIN